MKAISKIINFFEKIRASSEAVRRFWLMVFTGGSVVVVVGFWIMYINIIVDPVNGTLSESPVKEEPGVAETFAAGVRTAARGGSVLLGNALQSLRDALKASRTVNIDGGERNFIVEDLEPIPETALP